jgi:hypothetical protein
MTVPVTVVCANVTALKRTNVMITSWFFMV